MDLISLFYSSTPMPLEELGGFFNHCESAFRYEALPEYRVDFETKYIEMFKNKLAMPEDFNADWLSTLEAAALRSAPFSRVRKMPDFGTGLYIDFEFEWGYRRSVKKGEQIRLIKSSIFSSLTDVPIDIDFWLFNENICCLMYYDRIGRFLGACKVSENMTNAFKNIRDILIANSEQAKF